MTCGNRYTVTGLNQKLFKRAAAEGKLERGTVARRGNTPTTTIRLDPEDIAKPVFTLSGRALNTRLT
jgi:hypothetical protein